MAESLHEYTMEELLELQVNLGTKGISKEFESDNPPRGQKPQKKSHTLQNTDKDKPLEVSMIRHASKIPKKKILKETKSKARDPRFDELSGPLNTEKWKKKYNFLLEMREKEKSELLKATRKVKNGEQSAAIRNTIRRMNNQERAQKRFEEKRNWKEEQMKSAIESLKQGKRPHYETKKVFRERKEVEQVHQLKKNNKYDKYILKKEKRQHLKERRKNPSLKIM